MKISNLFATKRARVIMITVSVVLVLAVVMSIVLYATGYILPYDADGTPSARLLNTIKREYAAHWEHPREFISAKDVRILYCGANYSGCVPVFIDTNRSGYYQVLTEERIGGILFTYSDSHTLEIWRFGRFYTLSEAYERGWVDSDDLLEIRDGFYAFKKNRFKNASF